jgi:hypothetical protein
MLSEAHRAVFLVQNGFVLRRTLLVSDATQYLFGRGPLLDDLLYIVEQHTLLLHT